VISASSQTARSKPADRVDYLSVTSLQTEMNTTLRQATDASAPTALGLRSAPSTASGGYLLNTDPGRSSFQANGFASDNLFGSDAGIRTGGVSFDGMGPGTIIANGSSSHGGKSNGHGNKKGPRGDRRRDWRRDRDKKDGVHAAPEPSTWLLLGAGLAMVGFYEFVRRRNAA
jgi:hypothetical protein